MKTEELKQSIPQKVYDRITRESLRPSQYKAIQNGLFEKQNLLICTPTGSGKTFVAELAFLQSILVDKKKAIYIVPLKALASEKHLEFLEKYPDIQIAKSIGDKDAADTYLAKYDLIITTSEKLDSLMRHGAPWIKDLGVVIVDEIHNLNDMSRGPTLEIVITLLRTLTNCQIIALSATIGNPQELADWLSANLIIDTWRPAKLHKGVHLNGEIEFFDTHSNKEQE
jgi:helicase